MSRGGDPTRDTSTVFNEVQSHRLDVLRITTQHHALAVQDGGWIGRDHHDFKARFVAQGPRRPIYFQEPNRFPCPNQTDHDSIPQHYKDAVRDAKAAGAAAVDVPHLWDERSQ
jgi:hypothetical protein